MLRVMIMRQEEAKKMKEAEKNVNVQKQLDFNNTTGPRNEERKSAPARQNDPDSANWNSTTSRTRSAASIKKKR